MSRYRRVSTRVWGDEKFCALSKPPPCAQFLWFRLLTGPHTTSIPGLSCHIGEAGLAEGLGWPLRAFRACWGEIAGQGMAEADWQARVIFLPRAIEHNEPESPSVVQSWLKKTLPEVPECALKRKAIFTIGTYLHEKMGAAWSAAWVPGWESALVSGSVAGRPPGSQTGSEPGSRPSGSGTGEVQEEPPIVLQSRKHQPANQPDQEVARQAAMEILQWLNAKTGKNFRAKEVNLKLIRARLRSGILPEQLKAIVSRKVREWKGTDSEKYLRPATLFNETKCEQYVGELPAIAEAEQKLPDGDNGQP